MTPRATQWQRWFIRALARDSGKQPEEWLQEAKEAGAHAPTRVICMSSRGFLIPT